MPRLFVLEGDDVGATFEVRESAEIGRQDGLAVCLRDPSVSRRHARLERRGRRWALVDLGSRNGIVMRGERVELAYLVDMDEVRLGQVTLRFREEVEGEGTAARAPERRDPPARAETLAATRLVRRGPGGAPQADAPELEEEIDLDALARARRTGAARARDDEEEARAARRAVAEHRAQARGGLLTDSLDELPLWARAGIFLAVLALGVALAWGVFHLVVGLRSGA